MSFKNAAGRLLLMKKLNQKQKDIVTECFYKKRSGESYIEIARSFGINRRTLFGYRDSEEGRKIEKELRQNLINESYEGIMEALIDRAHQGSYQHAKLYLQVMGHLTNVQEVNVKQEIKGSEPLSDDLLAQLDELLKQ